MKKVIQLSIFAAAGGEGLKVVDVARPPAIAELRRKTQAVLSRFRRGRQGVVKPELQLRSPCNKTRWHARPRRELRAESPRREYLRIVPPMWLNSGVVPMLHLRGMGAACT